ncbi:hypothetical protein A2U01_0092009, partial [Trifolium medium]|nr:hypothetical protein [Trifolium medium]
VRSDLILDRLNSIVMELGREQVLMRGAVDFFGILMAGGSKATLGRLECVMLFMLLSWIVQINHTWREGNRSVD